MLREHETTHTARRNRRTTGRHVLSRLHTLVTQAASRRLTMDPLLNTSNWTVWEAYRNRKSLTYQQGAFFESIVGFIRPEMSLLHRYGVRQRIGSRGVFKQQGFEKRQAKRRSIAKYGFRPKRL